MSKPGRWTKNRIYPGQGVVDGTAWAALLIASVLALSACDRKSAAPTPAPTAATRPASAPATAVGLFDAPTSAGNVPDDSLAANEYISLGIPSHDRRWVGQDMAAAASKLRSLAAQSPAKLPRAGSSRSGPVFDRIVSADNLKFFRSRSLPLSARFPDAITYAESQTAILKTYLAARESNAVTGRELVELMGAQLRLAGVMLELVDEFVPTLSKDDPKYPVRMAGLDQMRQGLAGAVAGSVITLTESQFYDVDSRTKLMAYCRETFPSIVPKLTVPSQQEVVQRLDALVEHDAVRPFRSEAVSLRHEVRAALGINGSPPGGP